jgi:hypothetical protein
MMISIVEQAIKLAVTFHEDQADKYCEGNSRSLERLVEDNVAGRVAGCVGFLDRFSKAARSRVGGGVTVKVAADPAALQTRRRR